MEVLMNTVTMATRRMCESEMVPRETMELNLGTANEGTWLDLVARIQSKDSGGMWSSKRERKDRSMAWAEILKSCLQAL